MITNKIIILIFFTLNVGFCNSQNLNLSFIEQLTEISFDKVDEAMIDGYGFVKSKKDEDNRRHYIKYDAQNPDDTMLITIIKSKEFSKNAMDIRIGKNYSITKIKNNLADEGFLYSGSKHGLSIYKKIDLLFLIDNEPNEVGATQIMITYVK